MNIQYFLEQMKSCKNADEELGHCNADKILCDLVTLLASQMDSEVQQGVQEVLKEYEDLDKWYA
jgi:hypothetical protein